MAPSMAYGNAGIPMLVVAWPAMWVLFFPVVLLEAWVARRTLHMSQAEARREVTAANVVSTIVGIPVAWGLHLALELYASRHVSGYPETDIEALRLLFLSAPWIGVWSAEVSWLVPAAALALLLGFWAVSVATEALVMRHRNDEVSRAEAWAWAWRANTLSYGIIGILTTVWLAYETAQTGRITMK